MPQARDEAGNIWEVDAQGNPIRLVQAANQGQVFSLPLDPNTQQQMQSRNVQMQGDVIANQTAQATQAADIAKANAAAQKSQLELQQLQQQIASGGRTPAQMEDKRARISRLNQLVQQINRTQEIFDQGAGSTTGPASLRDYAPLDVNEQLDVAGAQLAEQGLGAFRIPGTGEVSNRDAMMFERGNLPMAGNRDIKTREQLRGLRARVEEELKSLGAPPPDWTGSIPDDEKKAIAERTSVWSQTYVAPPTTPGAAPPGSGMQRGTLPPGMQDEMNAYMQDKGKGASEAQLANFLNGLYSKYNAAADPMEAANWAKGTARRIQQGGTINYNLTPGDVPLSGLDAARNAIVNNPLGAGAVGFADTMGFGGVSALDRLTGQDRMGALGEANPYAMMLGEIGGSIAGTQALGALGRNTLGRAIPSLMSASGKAKLARELGTDVLYSGITGANQGQDPLAAMALGGAGTLAGRGVGKVASKAIGGLPTSNAVEVLRRAGVPMTIGQQVGGALKGIEDRFTSIPGVGDLVNARRLEGFQALEDAALREAGAPIGATPSSVEDLMGYVDPVTGQRTGGAISDAYSNATAGLNAPLDATFQAEMAANRAATGNLPADYAARAQQMINNRVAPVEQAGMMTGDLYQQAMRGLKSARSGATGAAPGFEPDYKDLLTQVMGTLTEQAKRGGGQNVVSGLAQADEAYRLGKTLEAAKNMAASGKQTGELYLPTPNQLQRAGQQTVRKFPGAQPFKSLADAAQAVLPSSVPDSGTAGRAAQMFLPAQIAGTAATLGATGAGVGYAAGDGAGAGAGGTLGLGTAALLALGGTKSGQKALEKILVRRPDSARKLGEALSKNAGIFGAGMIPLALAINR